MSAQTMAERVRAAVLTVTGKCEPATYRGNADEYATYTLSRHPVIHGDDRPHAIRYLGYVHLYMPPRVNPHAKIVAMCEALAGIGTYPTVEDASDLTTGHYVFEFEAVDGDLWSPPAVS